MDVGPAAGVLLWRNAPPPRLAGWACVGGERGPRISQEAAKFISRHHGVHRKPPSSYLATMASSGATPNQATRRAPKGPATLAPLLRHLRGLVVTVELKSGRSLRGILDESDSFMNIVLRKEQAVVDAGGAHVSSDALVKDDGDDDRPFDKVHIRGPLIRYIHLPPRADLARLIKDGTDRERRARDKYKRNVIRKKGEQR